MAVPSNSPSVTLLKEEFEKKFGRPIKTPKDFDQASDFIFRETHETISQTTFRRLYVPGQEYPNVSDDILNVLSKAIGFKHYQEFCDHISRVYIAWKPDRQCSLRYLGSNRFLVEEAENASTTKGDTFSCTMLVERRCLYVDNLEHDGKIFESYAMGMDGGLTCVKKL